MAGLRKPVRRKDTSKPSTALILFLVFFIVMSLGLGVWGYYGYAGQEEIRAKLKVDKATAVAGRLGEELWKYTTQEARLATGDTLTPDELAAWGIEREEFIKPQGQGKYAGEPAKAALEKWIKENKARLGLEENAKTYATNFREKVAKLEEELKTAKATLATTQANLKAAEDRFATLDKNQKASWKKFTDENNKQNGDILAATKARSAETEKSFKDFTELVGEKTAMETKFTEDLGKKDQLIKKLENVIKAKELENKEKVAANPAGVGTAQHALMLDTAKGKTLWDTPLGKITRIDLQAGQVYLNIGSSSGLKTEAPFLIFGANTSGYPEKMLKATVEVIRIVDRASSVARITALYDSDGKEIVLTDTAKGRLEREASNPLKEGDLVFNLFFGSRVAIAGVVSLSSLPPNSPAEQMRELDNFTYQLNRMGMTVDAFLDLNDGQIKGTIAPRTRFLIKGDELFAAAKAKEKDKDKDKDGDEKEKTLDPAQFINEQIGVMKKEAVDKGLFIVSLENFLNMTGLRRARGADRVEFRPGLPYAGAGLNNAFAPAPKNGDEKGGDGKEKEKEKEKEK